PLTIGKIDAEYRPYTAGLYAESAAPYYLASGNPRANSPSYELNSTRADVAKLKISEVTLGPLTPNPAYREPETLPGVAETGARIDLSNWKFRKQIQTSGPGIHQLTLDPETLSLAAP